jgi:AcrR family transcriptional regulator
MADAGPSLTPATAVADVMEQEEGAMTPAKRRIVEMAVLAFAEQGYAATSTRDIAARAGVSEAAIFRHFASKKDLLVRMVRPLAGRLIVPTGIEELGAAIATETSFEGIIRKLLTTRLAFARRYAPLVRIMVQEVPFHPELRDVMAPHVATMRVQVDMLLSARIANGQVRAIEVDRLLRIVASLFMGYVVASSLPVGRSWDDEAEIATMAGLLARGLAAD